MRKSITENDIHAMCAPLRLRNAIRTVTMKHIFLTGDIQIGKSTVIKKTLALLKLEYGGFCTYFGSDRPSPYRKLYINEASQPQICEEQNMVASFRRNHPPEVYPERFDRLGSEYLIRARAGANLIIMDECGNLEKEAAVFQTEILRTLDGEVPVLGVIKQSAGGWADQIRRHRRVSLFTVDVNNRDSLPAALAEMLRCRPHIA